MYCSVTSWSTYALRGGGLGPTMAYALWNNFICKLLCVLDVSETEGVNVLLNSVIRIIYNNVTCIVVQFGCLDLLAPWLQVVLITLKYSAIADLHTFQSPLYTH
jgi:hypothetical protein